MNILKEKDLYIFLQNLNKKSNARELLKFLTDYLREKLDADAVWAIIINPKTNLPLLKVVSKSQNFDSKKWLLPLNKLLADYFKGFESEDILEFLISCSKPDLMLEPLWFNGNLQGVFGVKGREDFSQGAFDFVKLILEASLTKLENFALIEENERTFKERMGFLASISHEFKTPLNSIIGFSELLKMKNSDAKLEKYIQNISASSKFLLDLILDVLELSRSHTRKMELRYETFPPKLVILEILATLENLIKEKNLEVSYDIAEITLTADLRRFRQLVLNLITNAVKFNKYGGKITIVAYKNEHSEFVFEIKDTGDGISKKDYSKIFKFFSQVNPNPLKRQLGSGIGLYLCKTIVEAHKGTIDFKSRLHHGSTFWFILPTTI